jgi:uncharacterized membrane protein
MDAEFLLGFIVLLLIAVIVLLAVLISKISSGFRTMFNYLDGIKDFKCNLIALSGGY